MPTLCAMIAADEPSKLRTVRPDVPEELEGVILRCLEKKPANRFANVADFGRALLPFAGHEGLAAVARITRIAAGTEATAASPVESVRPILRVPPPHEATAASPVAFVDKSAPSSALRPARRRWAVVVGLFLVAAISVAVVRIAGMSRSPALADDRPRPPLPLPSPLPVVANGALVAVEELRAESQPRVLPAQAPDAAVRLELPPQPMAKAKPRVTPLAPPSAVPPQTTEKLPLDPLIDQR